MKWACRTLIYKLLFLFPTICPGTLIWFCVLHMLFVCLLSTTTLVLWIYYGFVYAFALNHALQIRYAYELLTNPLWKRDYDIFGIDEQLVSTLFHLFKLVCL